MKMIVKFIFFTLLVSSATCRTAKNYREMVESARLSQAEFPMYNLIAPNGPGTYAFGYEIEDPVTKNVQFRDEERLPNGTVRGSYGVLLPDNTLHITHYIADQFGYRANSETKKKLNDGPLKIELQVQPTLGARPSISTTSPTPLRRTSHDYPFTQSTSTSLPNLLETVNPTIDPLVASQIFKQHQINLNPTYNPLRDPNILEPQIANAFLNQQYFVPQNPFFNSGLRQNYDGTVSTYASQPSQPWSFPFANWFNGNNQNNQNYQNYYQDPVNTNRPVIDFITNLANNNPLTNFINNWGQNDNPNTPVLNLLNNLNPLNLFANNNRPQTSLPITQGDYIPPTNMGGSQFITPSNNLDNSVFSNDHFLNPVTYYPNNQQIIHSYYPSQQQQQQQQMYHRPSQYQSYSAWPYNNNHNNHYSHFNQPYNYYNPYNYQSHNRKKNKRKKNKNKVDVESESDWFQDFLDKRKEASLELNTRRSSTRNKASTSDDDDDILDDYFLR